MSDTERRAILEAVAKGDLTPDEAAARLRHALHDLPHDPGPDPTTEMTPDPTRVMPHDDRPDDRPEDGAAPGSTPRPSESVRADSVSTARRIRIEANAGSVRVIGDPTVAVVDVDGDHEVNEEGGTIVVRCSPLRDINLDFDFDRDRDRDRDHDRLHSYGRAFKMRRYGAPLAIGELRKRVQVTVRVNPDLPLDVHISAGALTVRGINATIRCDVDAGAARLHDIRAPFTAKVSAGALTVDGRLVDGESRVSCDMGATTIKLDPTSDVRVKAGVNLGRCDVKLGPDGGDTLGAGTGVLVIDGSMSSVSVTTRST